MSQRDPASLIRHYAGSHDPDQRTSMADARISLCLARGVDMDDIDPASGYNYSRDAYDRCRDSWVWNIKQHGFSSVYEGTALARAIATWTAHRPGFIEGDDWLAAATEAHFAHWSALGRCCPRETCDLHAAESDNPEAAEPRQGVQDSLFDEFPQSPVTVPSPRRRAITNVHLSA